MEDKEEQKEIKIQQRDEECDTSTISEKPDASDSSTREKATHSIRPAFICTSVLTVILPILWFVVTAMVSGTGDGYDSLWYVRLLGGDSVGDTSNGRGIIILLSFGWTFGLFLVFFIQGNSILRAIYGNVDPRADKRLSFCASKKKMMEPQGVDERKLGILIGCLFCFSNLCFILCFSFAWPAVRALVYFVFIMLYMDSKCTQL